MKTGDIPGAQIGTLKKGMSTQRHLDPQNPGYTFPGHTEPEPIFNRNTQYQKTKTVTQSQFMSTVKSKNEGAPKTAQGQENNAAEKPQIRRPSQ
mmetsp:Transcript_6872/g.6166  ORF Transcript_6872/g.6166 Transcript_6872/m.6166 type:complete len:94 (-) Transcript_6872:464-745(-)